MDSFSEYGVSQAFLKDFKDLFIIFCMASVLDSQIPIIFLILNMFSCNFTLINILPLECIYNKMVSKEILQKGLSKHITSVSDNIIDVGNVEYLNVHSLTMGKPVFVIFITLLVDCDKLLIKNGVNYSPIKVTELCSNITMNEYYKYIRTFLKMSITEKSNYVINININGHSDHRGSINDIGLRRIETISN